jgi:Protein of unknown function (DUF3634)
MLWALLALATVIGWVLLGRANELFCLSWRHGELRVVRGRIPPALKHDLADALTRMKVAKATVRAHKEERGARLTASGVDDFSEQRLRNIFQMYPYALLRAAPLPKANRTLRWLGIAGLVWWLGRPDE